MHFNNQLIHVSSEKKIKVHHSNSFCRYISNDDSQYIDRNSNPSIDSYFRFNSVDSTNINVSINCTILNRVNLCANYIEPCEWKYTSKIIIALRFVVLCVCVCKSIWLHIWILWFHSEIDISSLRQNNKYVILSANLEQTRLHRYDIHFLNIYLGKYSVKPSGS